MARKIGRWLSLTDLANRASKGKYYQLSARVVGEAFYVYYREEGRWYWHPVATETKKVQLSYNVANLAALLTRVKVLACPFEFFLNGVRYGNTNGPFTCLVALSQQVDALDELYKGVLFSVLHLDRACSGIEDIAARILYDYAQLPPMAQGMVRQMIQWPPETRVFDDAPCALPKEMPGGVFTLSSSG